MWQSKNLLATLVLAVIIIVCVVCSYLVCNKIAVERSKYQFEDAANNVIDQISTKVERDGQILKSIAQMLAESGAFDGKEAEITKITDTLNVINPLRGTMNLRVLMPDNSILFPEGDFIDSLGVFDFEHEKLEGQHISKRFNSRREGFEGAQLIAHFFPVVVERADKTKETVAMIYGATALSDLPSALRVSNIYNNNAKIIIYDTKSEGREIIMDTLHEGAGSLGVLDRFGDVDFDDIKTYGKTPAVFLLCTRGQQPVRIGGIARPQQPVGDLHSRPLRPCVRQHSGRKHGVYNRGCGVRRRPCRLLHIHAFICERGH